jgi:hypothetical protein
MNQELFSFLNKINDKLEKIENRLLVLEKKSYEIVEPITRIEFGIKKIKLSYQDGLRYLSENDLNSDINITKLIYITDIQEPQFRFIGRSMFQYWKDSRWNDDPNGVYIIKIVLTCLASFYSASNNLIMETNRKDFLENMKYIEKIGKHKYQTIYLNELKKICQI